MSSKRKESRRCRRCLWVGKCRASPGAACEFFTPVTEEDEDRVIRREAREFMDEYLGPWREYATEYDDESGA